MKERSSHLYGAIARACGESALPVVAEAFSFAIAKGGESEIGFDREIGVSFNPRPGRVGLILLNDCFVRDSQIVAAGLLATATKPEEFVAGVSRDLAIEARIPMDGVSRLSPAARAVRVALTLDFGRHLHQLTRGDSNFPPFIGDSAERLRSEYRNTLPLVIEMAREFTNEHGVARIHELLKRIEERNGE